MHSLDIIHARNIEATERELVDAIEANDLDRAHRIVNAVGDTLAKGAQESAGGGIAMYASKVPRVPTRRTTRGDHVNAHTPGPWEVTESGDQLEVMQPDGDTVATVYEGMANARLIAAAPALLEALESLVNECGILDPGDPARAAIRAAKGKG